MLRSHYQTYYNRLYLNKEHCGKHQRKYLKVMNNSCKLSYIKTLKILRKLNFEEKKTKNGNKKNISILFLLFSLSRVFISTFHYESVLWIRTPREGFSWQRLNMFAKVKLSMGF